MEEHLAHHELKRLILLKNFSIAAIAAAALVLCFVVVRLTGAPPLIVERDNCGLNRARLEVSGDLRTKDIEMFVREVMPQRFEQEVSVSHAHVSVVEAKRKKMEFDQLTKDGISQRILIREIKVAESGVFAEIDRILSHDKVRAVFPLKLRLELEVVDRSGANPYGLILASTHEITEEESKNDKR